MCACIRSKSKESGKTLVCIVFLSEKRKKKKNTFDSNDGSSAFAWIFHIDSSVAESCLADGRLVKVISSSSESY